MLGVRRCGRRPPALLSERNVRRLHHCGGTAGGGGSAQQRPRRRAPGTAGTEPPLPPRCCPPLPAPAEGHRGAWHQPPVACAAGRGCCISPAPSRGPRPEAAGGAGGRHEGASRSGSGGTCRLPRPPVAAELPEQPGAASPGLCARSPPRAAAAAAGVGGGAGGSGAGGGPAGQDHPRGAAPRSRQHPRGAAPGRGSAASLCLSDNLGPVEPHWARSGGCRLNRDPCPGPAQVTAGRGGGGGSPCGRAGPHVCVCGERCVCTGVCSAGLRAWGRDVWGLRWEAGEGRVLGRTVSPPK